MSILVEIAEKADVSVEGVVRVLTREPVSDAIKERVLAVLDDLTPEQTRAVQRFALAALHDVLLRPGDTVESFGDAVAPDENQLALPVSTEPPEQLPATTSDAALVQLSSVLGELAEAVRDLRRETDAERRERVDDLAVLIDLITTGWQGLDARLGRIERVVGRLEPGRLEPVRPVPVRAVPATVDVDEPDPTPPAEPRGRDRLPGVAALALLGAVGGTLAVLQLASGGPDVSGIVAAGDTASPTTRTASSTVAAPTSTRAKTRPAATTTAPSPSPAPKSTLPAATSSVLGTTAPGPARPKPVPATIPKTTSAGPATTPRVAPPAGFQPTRNWAWAPVPDAAYYEVIFSRAGVLFYRATPTAANVTLPGSLVFRPGAYRWIVRPGFGERSAKELGLPVVDSSFVVGA